MLQAIAGTDNIDDRGFAAPSPENIPKYYEILKSISNPSDLNGKRIGLLKESLDIPAMDPRVRACFLAATEKFKQLGASVEEVSIPMHKAGAAVWTGISKVGTEQAHE